MRNVLDKDCTDCHETSCVGCKLNDDNKFGLIETAPDERNGE